MPIEKKEFVITRKIWMAFKASMSYKDFLKKITQESLDSFSSEITIRNVSKKPFWDEDETFLRAYKIAYWYEYTFVDKYRYKVERLEYIMFSIRRILGQCWMDSSIKYQVVENLRYNVKEVFRANTRLWNFGINFFSHRKKENDCRDFVKDLEYIKYNSSKKYEKDEEHIVVLESFKFSYDFCKMLNKVNDMWRYFNKIHFKKEKQKSYALHYIIYCTLYLQQDLYLIYLPYHLYPKTIIIEKNQVDKYIKYWTSILSISEIIWNIFGHSVTEDVRNKKNSMKSRDSVLQDMRTNAKKAKKVVLQLEVEDSTPKFMSWKRDTNDVSSYNELEKYIGDFWEITKSKSRWKTTKLKAKKKYIYSNWKAYTK